MKGKGGFGSGNLGSQKFEAQHNIRLFYEAVANAKPSKGTSAWRKGVPVMYKRNDGRAVLKKRHVQQENEEMSRRLYNIFHEDRRANAKEYVPGWRIGNVNGGMCIDCYKTENPLVETFDNLHSRRENKEKERKRIAAVDGTLKKNIALYRSNLSPAAHKAFYDYNRYRSRFFFNKNDTNTVLHLGLMTKVKLEMAKRGRSKLAQREREREQDPTSIHPPGPEGMVDSAFGGNHYYNPSSPTRTAPPSGYSLTDWERYNMLDRERQLSSGGGIHKHKNCKNDIFKLPATGRPFTATVTEMDKEKKKEKPRGSASFVSGTSRDGSTLLKGEKEMKELNDKVKGKKKVRRRRNRKKWNKKGSKEVPSRQLAALDEVEDGEDSDVHSEEEEEDNEELMQRYYEEGYNEGYSQDQDQEQDGQEYDLRTSAERQEYEEIVQMLVQQEQQLRGEDEEEEQEEEQDSKEPASTSNSTHREEGYASDGTRSGPEQDTSTDQYNVRWPSSPLPKGLAGIEAMHEMMEQLFTGMLEVEQEATGGANASNNNNNSNSNSDSNKGDRSSAPTTAKSKQIQKRMGVGRVRPLSASATTPSLATSGELQLGLGPCVRTSQLARDGEGQIDPHVARSYGYSSPPRHGLNLNHPPSDRETQGRSNNKLNRPSSAGAVRSGSNAKASTREEQEKANSKDVRGQGVGGAFFTGTHQSNNSHALGKSGGAGLRGLQNLAGLKGDTLPFSDTTDSANQGSDNINADGLKWNSSLPLGGEFRSNRRKEDLTNIYQGRLLDKKNESSYSPTQLVAIAKAEKALFRDGQNQSHRSDFDDDISRDMRDSGRTFFEGEARLTETQLMEGAFSIGMGQNNESYNRPTPKQRFNPRAQMLFPAVDTKNSMLPRPAVKPSAMWETYASSPHRSSNNHNVPINGTHNPDDFNNTRNSGYNVDGYATSTLSDYGGYDVTSRVVSGQDRDQSASKAAFKGDRLRLRLSSSSSNFANLANEGNSNNNGNNRDRDRDRDRDSPPDSPKVGVEKGRNRDVRKVSSPLLGTHLPLSEAALDPEYVRSERMLLQQVIAAREGEKKRKDKIKDKRKPRKEGGKGRERGRNEGGEDGQEEEEDFPFPSPLAGDGARHEKDREVKQAAASGAVKGAIFEPRACVLVRCPVTATSGGTALLSVSDVGQMVDAAQYGEIGGGTYSTSSGVLVQARMARGGFQGGHMQAELFVSVMQLQQLCCQAASSFGSRALLQRELRELPVVDSQAGLYSALYEHLSSGGEQGLCEMVVSAVEVGHTHDGGLRIGLL